MSWLVANSVVAGGLALLVMAVGRLLRPAPASMHVLWLFVLLKLATPPLFEVPIDVSWLRGEPVVVEPIVVPWELGVGPPDAPGLAAPAATPAASTPASASTLGDVLPWVWGLGSVLFVGLCLFGVASGHLRLRSLGPVPPWLRREVEMLAARLDVRVPELLDDPAAASPCVWSLGRARLVLPVSVLAASSPKGRGAVLAHELAHLRRCDHWLACLELLLAGVLWWHPLFWFARARLRLWAELACDAWAIASVPEATIDYATVLVEAVARPDSAVPGMTVLAARPAARAAFERRLTMILNENVPCRGSRAWWLPFTTLGLGLFAMPVAAQEEKPEVRIEIKVNGKELKQLSTEERRALLQSLLQEDADAKPVRSPNQGKKKIADEPQDPTPKGAGKPGKSGKPNKTKKATSPDALEGMPSAEELRATIAEGLAEARESILDDKDLRELGITDEVRALIDSITKGKGLDESLDSVVKAAMKGAGKLVTKELNDDPDLRKLGLADGIGKLVTGLLENERNQDLMGEFVRRTAKSALQDAKIEVRNDADLKKLGITVDVEDLIDNLFSGKGDFEGSLQTIIDKAIKAAMRGAEVQMGEASEELEQDLAAPKKKLEKKTKEGRNRVPEIR